jgi:hypothetical protein
MKFTTVAASAVLFSSMVMAMPNKVVYETEVVTITSCAPDVTDCPYRTQAPEPETTTSCSTSTEVEEPTPYPEEPTPYPEEVTPTPYPTSHEVYPEPETTTTPCTESTTHEVYPEPTSHEVYPEPETTTTPCPESTSISPPVTYPNTTIPVCPGGYGCHVETTLSPEATYPPECPGGYGCKVPTGTGVPYPAPVNTSTPYIPTPPPVTNEGGASKLTGSLIAVMGVAALALFA